MRIELIDYDPTRRRCSSGCRSTPYVYFKEPPTGADAGQVLQAACNAARLGADQVSSRPHFDVRGAPPSTPGSSPCAVVIPTFMEVLDTTIANVALRYIAGGLSAAVTDSEWVITSYLAANAIVLPISGWLSARSRAGATTSCCSIAVFTLASALCGMATSLEQLIPFRILQGLAGGGLQPIEPGRCCSMPFRRRSKARPMTIFGIAALIAPGRRPDARRLPHRQLRLALDLLSNVPVGLFASGLLPRRGQRSGVSAKSSAPSCASATTVRFHRPGAAQRRMVAGKSLLSKGQEWDWFGDPVLARANARGAVCAEPLCTHRARCESRIR